MFFPLVPCSLCLGFNMKTAIFITTLYSSGEQKRIPSTSDVKAVGQKTSRRSHLVPLLSGRNRNLNLYLASAQNHFVYIYFYLIYKCKQIDQSGSSSKKKIHKFGVTY